MSGRGEEVEWMNWVEIGRGSGKDENRVKVGWVEGGRYFVGGFKCARNYSMYARSAQGHLVIIIITTIITIIYSSRVIWV